MLKYNQAILMTTNKKIGLGVVANVLIYTLLKKC